MTKFTFQNRKDVFVIAEIGVNHNGSIDQAKRLVDAAIISGADAVKFQSFSASRLANLSTPKVEYQKRSGDHNESHFTMLSKLEFSIDNFREIKSYCDAVGILFFSTPYDVESAKELEDLGVLLYKTASADITDVPLHEYLASTGKPVVIGTAMATIAEIEAVANIYLSTNSSDIVLLHGVSNYPCSDMSQNLNVITTLRQIFEFGVGLTDHSEGSMSAIISVSLGARVVEKHFTLDRQADGPDHAASSEPHEFKRFVDDIRRTEILLGSKVKMRQEEEASMALVSRKSLHYSSNLASGETVSLSDFKLMRPGTGIGYSSVQSLLGRKLNHSVNINQIVKINDFE